MISRIKIVIVLFISIVYSSQATNNWFKFDSLNSMMEVNRIGEVIVDKNDNVWFTVAGYDSLDTFKVNLYKYGNGKFTAFNPMNSLPGSVNNILDLIIDQDGNPWICNSNFTIAKYENNKWSNFQFDSTQNEFFLLNRISHIAIDNNHKIWVGAWQAIYQLDPNMKLISPIYKYPHDPHGILVNSMLVDKSNNLWFAPNNDCLFKTTGLEYTRFEFDSIPRLKGSTLSYLVLDSAGNIWFRSYASEANFGYFNGTNYEIMDTNITKLKSNSLSPLGVDRYNNLWCRMSILDKSTMKYKYAGLVKQKGNNWIVYDTLNSGIPTNKCNSISFDKYDNKWIGTDIGLVVFNEGEDGLILGVEDEQIKYDNDIILNPNPATNFIEISGTDGEIKIFNVFGEMVKNFTTNLHDVVSVRIDVSGLPSGVYFVRVWDRVRKFVKL